MSRYVLARDPQYEAGWVYRAEPTANAPNRYDLFNELSPAASVPAYRAVALRSPAFAILPDAVYQAILRGHRTGHAFCEALADTLNNGPPGCARIQTITGSALRAAALAPPPFGPGFAEADLAGADALEVWGTTFAAPTDFVEYRLMRAEVCLRTRRVAGY